MSKIINVHNAEFNRQLLQQWLNEMNNTKVFMLLSSDVNGYVQVKITDEFNQDNLVNLLRVLAEAINNKNSNATIQIK